MKKRLACLFLGLTLCFGLRPALAAEAGVFPDVRDSDWFAPYVRVCVDHGLMEGTGAGRFEPDRELTLMEVWALEAKLEAWARGESVPHFPVVSLSDLAVFYDGTGARLGTIGDCIYEPKVYYGYNTFYFTLPQELQVQAGEGAVTLELNLDVLKAWPKDPLEEFRPLPEGSVRYEGGWDASRSCYIIPFGDDLGGKGPELLKLLDGLMTTEELLKEAWFRDSLLYTSSIGAHGLLSELHLDEFSAMADSQEQIDWSLGGLPPTGWPWSGRAPAGPQRGPSTGPTGRFSHWTGAASGWMRRSPLWGPPIWRRYTGGTSGASMMWQPGNSPCPIQSRLCQFRTRPSPPIPRAAML